MIYPTDIRYEERVVGNELVVRASYRDMFAEAQSGRINNATTELIMQYRIHLVTMLSGLVLEQYISKRYVKPVHPDTYIDGFLPIDVELLDERDRWRIDLMRDRFQKFEWRRMIRG